MNIILPTLREERRKTYCPFLPICPDTGKVLEIPLIEMSKKNQLSNKTHLKLSKICKKFGKKYACTAFDLDSLKFLVKKIKIPFIKIGSGEITSIDLLEYISRQNLPIVLSTGMATIKEIKEYTSY